MRIEVTRLDLDLPLPMRAHATDAGIDLYAAEDISLAPGERAAIPTGVAIAVPDGYAGFVQPRSGRALNEGLGIVNAPGLIDSGYRGEIKVIAINHDRDAKLEIKRGEKIAQLVVQEVVAIELVEVDELPPSERGAKGFGSSGN
ncbi:MAG: dUTP diphosphatase [Actinomycetota bacterium]|nr:dUTP diphosphatase [Actinomycetota bacterium]